MKRVLLLAAYSCIAMLSMAQSSTTHDKNAQTRDVKGFHAIWVSNGIDLYVSQGNESVAVSAAETEYRDQIKTVVEDGVLKIYLDKNRDHHFWDRINPKLKAYVSVSSLDNLHASGGSDVYVEGGLKMPKLDIDLSGGSDLKGKLSIQDLSIDQSGGSDVDISGNVINLKIDASGGSDFSGYDLQADNCHITASGGSDMHITVNKELNVDASGGSDVFYRGSAVIREMKSSGSSSISKRG